MKTIVQAIQPKLGVASQDFQPYVRSNLEEKKDKKN